MAQVLMTAQVPPTIDVTREDRPMGYATRHHRAVRSFVDGAA